jgi:hypothetical protein
VVRKQQILKLTHYLYKYAATIKIVIIILIVALIYHQLSTGEGQSSLQYIWSNSRQQLRPAYLLICLILMPLNWYLEALKFQKLMIPHINLSLRTSTTSVLGGLAAGIVTPGRIGEYAGRLFLTDPRHKTEVISATLLGSIAQNLCNIMVGLGFSYYFLKSAISVTYSNTFAFIAMIVAQILVLVYVYYHLPDLAHVLEKLLGKRLMGNYSKKLKALDLYSLPLLHKVLFFAAMRYVVYFVQYMCIMHFFNVPLTFTQLGSNIAGIYMIQTGIPLPAFLSILARGELAVFIWGSVGVADMTALAATFSLWFINLIIPALAGIIILFKTDIK